MKHVTLFALTLVLALCAALPAQEKEKAKAKDKEKALALDEGGKESLGQPEADGAAEYQAEIKKQLTSLQKKIEALVKKHGEKSKQVVRAKAQLAILKADLGLFEEPTPYEGGRAGLETAQQYREDVKKQIKEAEKRIAAMKEKFGEKSKQFARAKERLEILRASTGELTTPFEGKPGIDGTTEYQDEMKKRAAKLKAQIAELTKKHGADSKQVAKAKQRLEVMMANLGEVSGGPKAFEGDLTATYRQTLAGAGGEKVGDDPFGFDDDEDGTRLVVRGLEFQVAGLAAQLKRTKNEERRAALTKQLREVAAAMVDARKKARASVIEQLEKKLEAARKEAKSGDSVENIVSKALGKDKKADKKADKKDSDKDGDKEGDDK